MKTVGSRELKNRLGRYLGLVRRGETIIVTDRGKTVAHLTPPASEEQTNNLDDLLKRLEAEGHLRLAKDPYKRMAFKPIVTKGKPASQMVIEDRE
jgi:prevent-host-death family protein